MYDDCAYNHTPLITYTWGWDLSDSLQGAGDVGGLLMSCERRVPTKGAIVNVMAHRVAQTSKTASIQAAKADSDRVRMDAERNGEDMTEEKPPIEDPTKSERRFRNALEDYKGREVSEVQDLLDKED